MKGIKFLWLLSGVSLIVLMLSIISTESAEATGKNPNRAAGIRNLRRSTNRSKFPLKAEDRGRKSKRAGGKNNYIFFIN